MAERTHLVWVDPVEWNTVLDNVEEMIRKIDEWVDGESGHVLQDVRDGLVESVRVFRPEYGNDSTGEPEQPVLA